MKNINSVRPNSTLLNLSILIFRLFVGISMLTHGIPKLKILVGSNTIEFMNFLGMGSIFSMFLVVFAEFLCSIFLIAGLFTRLACVPLIITMLVACFNAHAGDPYAERELSVLYLSIYFMIIVLGSGRYSLDQLMTKKTETY